MFDRIIVLLIVPVSKLPEPHIAGQELVNITFALVAKALSTRTE